jgi:hypothetical protein
MGNSSSSYSEDDKFKEGIVKDESANDPLYFFRGMHIKWVTYIVDEIKKDDSNTWNLEEDNKLSWRKYFQIMMKLEHEIANDKEKQLRTSWHPATIGFKLVKKTDNDNDSDIDDENINETKEKSYDSDDDYKVVVEDDHTDDEVEDDIDIVDDKNLKKFTLNIDNDDNNNDDNPDELENENLNENNAIEDEKKSDKIDKSKTATPVSPRSVLEELILPPDKKTVTKLAKKPKNWDPTFFNPIYFGVKPYTIEQYDAKEKAQENIRKQAEMRAIEKAKSQRSEAIGQFEKQVKTQESVRSKKINNLDS